jgi:hypothetical protein
LKNELNNNGGYELETIAITGEHDSNEMEKIVIALTDSVYPNGLNMTIGGKGVVRPNVMYETYKNDVKNVFDKLKDKRFVSYDVLFMKSETKLKETEFNVLKKLSLLENGETFF